MLVDESKIAVDSFFSFLNLRKQPTNLKLKLLFKIETQTTLTEQNCSTIISYDQLLQIAIDLTMIDQVQIAFYTLLSRLTNSDRPLYSYTSQPQIQKLDKSDYEPNI